jgi:hypothetical protein
VKIALVSGALLTALFAAVLWVGYTSSKKSAASSVGTDNLASGAAIISARVSASPEELKVSDLRVQPARDSYGGYSFKTSGFDISARITNNSQYFASNIKGDLVALDCAGGQTCEVTGREAFSDYRLSIPPGESAQLTVRLPLSSIAPAKHQRRWKLELRND